MSLFLLNFNWLFYNLFLALVSVACGKLMLKVKYKPLNFIFLFMWFIFLPNTIYLLTDLAHLFEDWTKVDLMFRILLVFQYAFFTILGIVTFVVSVYFFQKLIQKKSNEKINPRTFTAILILNFIVGFGVILGGIQRTNSWHIFINPIRVTNDILDVISSKEMLMLSVGVGILSNIIYFLCVKTVATWVPKAFLRNKKFFK